MTLALKRMGGLAGLVWSAGAAVLLGLLAPALHAQEPPPQTDPDVAAVNVSTAEDKAERFLRQGRYAEAIQEYQQLLEVDPGSLGYRLNLAVCFYGTGKYEDAKKIYKDVLDTDPTNIVALIQSARVEARLVQRMAPNAPERARLLSEIKQYLLDAARLGGMCLRAIRTYEELRALFDRDIELKLNVLQAPQTPRPVRPQRDPFHNPSPLMNEQLAQVTQQPGREGTVLSPIEQRKLVQRLRTLIAKIDELHEQKAYEEIAELWLEVEEILRQAEGLTMLELQRQLKELEQKVNEKRFFIKRLLLRAFYAQGERILTDMEVALNESDYLRVFELWQALEQHADRMTSTEKDFRRSAEDLLRRGGELQERAKLLEEIDKFTFRITGVVAGAGVAKAIINGRVLTENDQVYGEDKLPIEGLTVVKIKRRRVRFRYKDTDFERPLEQ